MTLAGIPRTLANLEKMENCGEELVEELFFCAKPIDELSVVGRVAEQSNPMEVMSAQILIEPLLARQAAINATGYHIDELERCLVAQREAVTWRQYENADNRLHRTIAEASRNTVLLALFDQLNAIRRAIVWGRLRSQTAVPPRDHHSFAQHDAIVRAIRERDQENAASIMKTHLEEVRDGSIRAKPNTE